MREAMRDANLSVPFFESDRAANKFTLTLLTHHFFNEKDIQWLKHKTKVVNELRKLNTPND